MVFSLQIRTWVLQTLLRKHRIFLPVPTQQQLPIVCGCFIFSTSYRWTESVDSKALCKGTRNKDESIKNNRIRKDSSSPHPFNVFATGSSKMRAINQKNTADVKDPVIPLMKGISPPEKPLSAEEWEKLKEEYQGYKNFEDAMFDNMIAHNSPIDVAKSLLVTVANRTGDIEYSLLVKYLLLCVSQEQIGEIYDIYNIMKAKYKYLEISAYSLFIKGLCGSQHWKETLTILETIKKFLTPTKQNYGNCIMGALLNQEMNLAFELFHEMVDKNVMLDLTTLKLFFDFCQCAKDEHVKKKCIRILYYLRENQVYPEKSLMFSIKQWFESIPGENWKGNLTTMNNSRQCPSCSQLLENINLNQEEFIILKEKIIKDVLEGSDTFRKTSPQELERFQTFMNERPPFDIVIDGLNVAMTSSQNVPSKTLLDAVLYLAQKNQRLLVLGRKHMLRNSRQWNKSDLISMQKKAEFFFTENVSEDDPFLLYATLHSGGHCMFVTRDLLRDHKACLSDKVTRHLFFKWQRGHQMVLSHYKRGKSIKFERALPYDTIVQTTRNTWHIPYDDSAWKRSSCEVPVKWLCLQKK